MDSYQPRASGQPLHILLLEDSDIDAELVETHLSAGHFEFILQRTADREGFVNLLRSEPDVILADYSLPDFDGLTALELTQQHDADIPFIFVSGVVGEDFATNAMQNGAVDYITKRNLRRLRGAVQRAVREATERRRLRRAEADLRASEVASRIALRAARLGGWDFDILSGRLKWDATCCAMFGISPDTAVDYNTFLSALHPDDRERVHQAIQRTITQPAFREFQQQFRIVRPSGEILWMESIGTSIFDNGICRRFVGIIRDITTEKQAELALLDRTASLQASVEQQATERYLLWANSRDLLVVLSRDGRVRDITPSWERVLDTPVFAVLGRPLTEFIHEDDVAAFRKALAMSEPRVSMHFDNRLRQADGQYRWFSWTASPDDNGTIYATARDVSEERAAADRLRLVEDALRQAQKMEAVGQLTGGIAHDFNNLLTGIIGSIDAIQRRLRRQSYDDLERFLEAAAGSAHRAAALTQRLLAFSRRQSLDVKAENIAGIIPSLEDLLRRSLGENIALTTKADADLWPAMTDRNQLESAILNLAINARDAMPGGGTLTVSVRNYSLQPSDPPNDGLQPGDYVLVAVEDSGEGMSEDVLAKAFDPFFTTKPIGQGTGLGLSMVYGFVTQTGGHVNIVSRLGVGTRIELYFRRADAEPAEAEPRADAADHKPDGEVVLVVEDDPSVRMLIMEVLSELGYGAIEAQDGGAALPYIQSDRRIDLIISDVGLPGLSGRELADVTRKQRPDVPILLVTGYAEGAQHREGYLGPGMEMMSKPFKHEALADRINALLHRVS